MIKIKITTYLFFLITNNVTGLLINPLNACAVINIESTDYFSNGTSKIAFFDMLFEETQDSDWDELNLPNPLMIKVFSHEAGFHFQSKLALFVKNSNYTISKLLLPHIIDLPPPALYA